MIDLSAHERGTVVRVRSRPNARRNGILGERAGSLRIGATVASEKGKASPAIAEVLAEALGCRTSSLVLLAGETSREERFLILGLDAESLRVGLEPLILDPH